MFVTHSSNEVNADKVGPFTANPLVGGGHLPGSARIVVTQYTV